MIEPLRDDDDAGACVALWTASVAARDGVQESEPVRSRALGKFALPRVAGFVARDAGLDGFVLVTEPGTGLPGDPGDAAVIGLLAVRPGVQGSGLGKRLLENALAAAEDRGFERSVLHVLTENTRAVGLYESMGFRPDGVPFPHGLDGRATQTFVRGAR